MALWLCINNRGGTRCGPRPLSRSITGTACGTQAICFSSPRAPSTWLAASGAYRSRNLLGSLVLTRGRWQSGKTGSGNQLETGWRLWTSSCGYMAYWTQNEHRSQVGGVPVIRCETGLSYAAAPEGRASGESSGPFLRPPSPRSESRQRTRRRAGAVAEPGRAVAGEGLHARSLADCAARRERVAREGCPRVGRGLSI